MHRVSDCFQASLRGQAERGASAALIGQIAVDTWRNVDAALSPVIGKGGFIALYRRSLLLTVRTHPWLAAAAEGDLRLEGLDLLQTTLSQQTGAVAAAANGALLQTFCDLLGGLIGAPLTEHLLQSAWGQSSCGLTDQEQQR